MTDKSYGINNVLQLAVNVGKQLEGLSYPFCFIGGVAFACRPQDWIDIEKIALRQGARLNRDLIVHRSGPGVKADRVQPGSGAGG